MKTRPSPPSQSGFSLAELLLVITVLAVLLVLALPTLQRIRQGAGRAVSVNHIRMVGGGLMAWMQEANRGRLPYAYVNATSPRYPAGFDTNALPKHYQYWAGAVYHGGYLQDITHFFAPDQLPYWKDAAFQRALTSNKNAWQWAMIGFGANGVLMPYSGDARGLPTAHITELGDRAQVILLAEAKPPPAQSSNGRYDGFHAVRPNRATYPVAVRGNMVAVCYADGHAGLLSPAELDWDEKEDKWGKDVSDTRPPWNALQ